jgi:hypothetical protein
MSSYLLSLGPDIFHLPRRVVDNTIMSLSVHSLPNQDFKENTFYTPTQNPLLPEVAMDRNAAAWHAALQQNASHVAVVLHCGQPQT